MKTSQITGFKYINNTGKIYSKTNANVDITSKEGTFIAIKKYDPFNQTIFTHRYYDASNRKEELNLPMRMIEMTGNFGLTPEGYLVDFRDIYKIKEGHRIYRHKKWRDVYCTFDFIFLIDTDGILYYGFKSLEEWNSHFVRWDYDICTQKRFEDIVLFSNSTYFYHSFNHYFFWPYSGFTMIYTLNKQQYMIILDEANYELELEETLPFYPMAPEPIMPNGDNPIEQNFSSLWESHYQETGEEPEYPSGNFINQDGCRFKRIIKRVGYELALDMYNRLYYRGVLPLFLSSYLNEYSDSPIDYVLTDHIVFDVFKMIYSDYYYEKVEGLYTKRGKNYSMYITEGRRLTYCEESKKYTGIDTAPIIAKSIRLPGGYGCYNYLIDQDNKLYKFGEYSNRKNQWNEDPPKITPELESEREYKSVENGFAIDINGHMWAIESGFVLTQMGPLNTAPFQMSNHIFDRMCTFYGFAWYPMAIDEEGVLYKFDMLFNESGSECTYTMASFDTEIKWKNICVFDGYLGYEGIIGLSTEGKLYQIGNTPQECVKLSEKIFIEISDRIVCDEDHHWHEIAETILPIGNKCYKKAMRCRSEEYGEEYTYIFVDFNNQFWIKENESDVRYFVITTDNGTIEKEQFEDFYINTLMDYRPYNYGDICNNAKCYSGYYNRIE